MVAFLEKLKYNLSNKNYNIPKLPLSINLETKEDG